MNARYRGNVDRAASVTAFTTKGREDVRGIERPAICLTLREPWRVLRASDISTDMPTSKTCPSAFAETQERAVRASRRNVMLRSLQSSTNL